MSDQEKASGGSGGSIVMVEKSASSRHKPYRPTELQDQTSADHHKHHKAPAVPSLAEELKVITLNESSNSDELVDREHAISSERHKSIEEIAMDAIQSRKNSVTASKQPIPSQAQEFDAGNLKAPIKADADSITEEITELRTSEAAKEHSEWSDEEEAGGLPRSESRASRVSRAVRQLFCCGVAYRAPSEDELPYRESSGI